MNIVCVSPHPDDIEYGIGGILLKLSGENNKITILTNEKYDFENIHTQDTIELRRDDSLRAAEYVSAKVVFFKLDDPLNDIANIIRNLKPEILFIPSCHETHPIHKLTNEVMLNAIDMAALTFNDVLGYQVNQLFYYETFSSDVIKPNFIIDVSQFYAKAKKMLYEHKHGIEILPSLPYKFQLYHQSRGFESSCMYGESLIMEKRAPYSWKENRKIGLEMLSKIFE